KDPTRSIVDELGPVAESLLKLQTDVRFKDKDTLVVRGQEIFELSRAEVFNDLRLLSAVFVHLVKHSLNGAVINYETDYAKKWASLLSAISEEMTHGSD